MADIKKVRFIDLFAGLGGLRLGFEQGFQSLGLETECVMTSEIKPHALECLRKNFTHGFLAGDIFDIHTDLIPDFDFLLGGFPCQPFSYGGKRQGFLDTRGTLFFEIERILKEKKPQGFILENVEGLVKHDLEKKGDSIGRTLKTILHKLNIELGYSTSWKVFDSLDFALPQSRKRIFIVGIKSSETIDLENYKPTCSTLEDILEQGLETLNSSFVQSLLKKYKPEELYGKSIKDKRGGENNIHSWDIELKGSVSNLQRKLLNKLFKERRKKHWAKEIGIDWMDGMPLSLEQIHSFFPIEKSELKAALEDLEQKGYLKFEHPKKLVREELGNAVKTYRIQDKSKPKGYNIVTGKLSFEINKILDPQGIAPTLVATDSTRIAVVDGKGLRHLSIREGLRLFGYPEQYQIPCSHTKAFDLLGNTVPVPVVSFVAKRIAGLYQKNQVQSKSSPVCNL